MADLILFVVYVSMYFEFTQFGNGISFFKWMLVWNGVYYISILLLMTSSFKGVGHGTAQRSWMIPAKTVTLVKE